MAFVNEYIPAEDIEKYDIENINKRFVIGGTNSRSWTIDRERNIYLRNVARGREEFAHQSTWTFFWQGELLEIDLELIDGGGKRGEPGWSHWRVRNLVLPQHVKCRSDEIIVDLRDALTAYKDGGVFSANTTYQITLDI